MILETNVIITIISFELLEKSKPETQLNRGFDFLFCNFCVT